MRRWIDPLFPDNLIWQQYGLLHSRRFSVVAGLHLTHYLPIGRRPRFFTIKKIMVAAFVLFAAVAATCQTSRIELEAKRKQLLREIRQTSRLLEQTKKNREATYSNYLTLQRQIERRLQLIETLRAEVLFILQNIERTTGAVQALTDDVQRLKSEYAIMVRHAYRQRLLHSDWLFVLSANSFNDAFRRWQYLRQYDRYRQKQAQLILDTQQTLLEKIAGLEKEKSEKERLLEAQERQSEMLGLEMSAKNRILEELKNDEARLARQLKAKERAAQKLTAAIEKVIKKEMEKARKEKERATANLNVSPSSSPRATSPGSLLGAEFRRSKSTLPWPVKSGIITGHFGRQQHPAIPSVQIVNNGIDIRTNHGTQVQAIFDGIVVGTQFIPGFDYMVILQHGDYYTVYSNLQEIKVRKGDKVKIRQSIGIVSTNRKTNTAEVHFEIWRGKTRLNPANWIRAQ